MNGILRTLLLALLTVAPVAGFAVQPPPVAYYVAPNGNDAWSGHLPQPDAAGSNGPFATLAHAQEIVRAHKAQFGLPQGGIVVWVRGGTYALSAPLAFTADDSGAAEAPVIYAAYPGETVTLSGGRDVTGWKEISDPLVLQRMDEAARAQVRCADLSALGITDFGEPDKNGLELFFAGKAMTLARWPNEGFVRIKDIVVDDSHAIHGIKGSTVGKFYYEEDRPSRWLGEQDPWAHGYWFWDWSDQRQRITSIDFGQKVLGLSQPYHNYGYRKGQWYYGFNLLCELDRPGEWYLDRVKGLLYFWPTMHFGSVPAVVSVLPTLVTFENTAYCSLRGFTFESARETAVRGSGVDHVEIARCTVRNVGGDAISLSGQFSGAAGCEVYQTGSSGIVIAGGDRAKLEPAGMYAVNNHIHHYGRINRMYTPGVAVNGVGHHVANNLIHSAPHMAVQFVGNDHLIECNEIHHVCQESNDAGAIYTGRDWLMRGNVIRSNYLHHIEGFEAKGCVGVYLDDMFASAAITGNIFYKVTRAAFIGGGRDCTVENNIFVDCKPALHVDCRALNWAAYHADEWIAEAKAKGTIKGFAYDQPPYSTKYPELLKLMDDEPKAPKGNRIARNICSGGKWDEVEEGARPYLAMESNWTQDDPQFVDAANLDFRLKPSSPMLAQGFQPIPVETIGLHRRGPSDEAGFESVCKRGMETMALTPDTLLGQARQLREQRDFEGARKMHKAVMAIVGLSPEKKAEARWELGHTGLAQKKYGKARAAYAALARDKAAPAPMRALGALQAGEMLAREGKTGMAAKAWNKTARIPGAPRVLLDEAKERAEAVSHPPASGAPAEAVSVPAPKLELFVSPQGNDTNPGTADQPLATFEGARQAVRKIKAKGPLPTEGLAVNFREGTYPVTQGMTLTEEDSGGTDSQNVRITYRAYNKEKAVFAGGKTVSGFVPVTDKNLLKQLPSESRGKVLQLDLKAQGITDFGTLQSRGMGVANPPSQLELFVDGTPMTLARWPNEGFVRTGKVIDAGSFAEKKGATFELNNDRITRWKQAKDAVLYGYWYWDWADYILNVAAIDIAAKRITTKQVSNYGLREHQEYYVFNLLEEIDRPGEYYLDRGTGVLYLYPPTDLGQAKVEVSMLDGPMLTLTKVSNVVFENLEFENGRSDAVVVRDGKNCAFNACLVKQFAGSGVRVLSGDHHSVFGCELHTLGRRGIELIGGDRLTLTPGGHTAENCYIHDFSRIDRTYTPAVQMEGVGNRVAHNHISQSPGHALHVDGNEHCIEFNEVDHAVLETDDQGGIDIWGNPTYRGNVFRYNYWHDIGNNRPCGQAGIRLDDAISGTVIYGNVFERCSGANFGGVQIHGGKDNWVDNNVFIDCAYGVSFTSWGDKRWKEFLQGDLCKNALKAVESAWPLYLERYPELAHLEEHCDVNNLWRNVVVNGQGITLRDRGIHSKIDNMLTANDPGFVDADAHRFGLRPNADVLDSIAFRAIPFEKIGRYPHPLAR